MLLICAYFNKVGYCFCVLGIECTRISIIIYLFFCVLKFSKDIHFFAFICV